MTPSDSPAAAPSGRYICIHGHFYQPPRENAWLETIELQDSAYPYHDWNQRITAECYEPNANSRILDDQKRITQIVNNYGGISFNFGPTLLSWLETNASQTYQGILEADRLSRARFSGHGSALAQVYSHPILPLCNSADKRSQVVWGIRDFERRFERAPEGMWLPETAVDLECLEILADHGIRFTVLAPSQADAVRPGDGDEWHDVSSGNIDPKQPYRIVLPSERTLCIYFYDGPISRAVAFERLLSAGDRFAHRLLSGFSDDKKSPQLVHIATDGETYGHHHRFGDMALAYAMHYIESRGVARITNYAEYLEHHPPRAEVRIRENTAWSCSHGLGRWQEDCGCSTGGHEGWNQSWRGPLREALDWLRDELSPRFERKASQWLRDPWAARDDYIDLILDRSPSNLDAFLTRHSAQTLGTAEQTNVLKLLELQRHAMLMYTSCGWFFDELSGIETTQILQYAGRALQLAEELFDESLEGRFLDRLENARSNIPEVGNGKTLFERRIRPARVDLSKVGANYAANTLFSDGEDRAWSEGFEMELRDRQEFEAGRARLVVGRIEVASKITLEHADLTFGFLHFGDHNLSGGVRAFRDQDSYGEMVDEVFHAFSRADLPEVMRRLDRHFLGLTYSLQTLFRDGQRRILDHIMESTLQDTEAVYQRLYAHHAPIMRFLKSLDSPPPKALRFAAEFVLNTSLKRALRDDEVDPGRLNQILEEARLGGIELEAAGLTYEAQVALESTLERFTAAPDDLDLLKNLQDAASWARSLPFDVDMAKIQNGYYRMLNTILPGFLQRADRGESHARRWVELFNALGGILKFVVP